MPCTPFAFPAACPESSAREVASTSIAARSMAATCRVASTAISRRSRVRLAIGTCAPRMRIRSGLTSISATHLAESSGRSRVTFSHDHPGSHLFFWAATLQYEKALARRTFIFTPSAQRTNSRSLERN